MTDLELLLECHRSERRTRCAAGDNDGWVGRAHRNNLRQLAARGLLARFESEQSLRRASPWEPVPGTSFCRLVYDPAVA